MRKTVLVCDRPCTPEEHRATRVVWIRAAGMGRPIRQDVCDQAYSVILGTPANGATPPAGAAEAPKPAVLFRPGSQAAKDVDNVRAQLARRSPMTLDQLSHALYGPKPGKGHTAVARALTALTQACEITSGPQGVFYRPGAPRPTRPRDELEAAKAVLRLVAAEPGIRSVYVGPLLGYDRTAHLKRLLGELVRKGGLRSKGAKSATRYYPGTGKS